MFRLNSSLLALINALIIIWTFKGSIIKLSIVVFTDQILLPEDVIFQIEDRPGITQNPMISRAYATIMIDPQYKKLRKSEDAYRQLVKVIRYTIPLIEYLDYEHCLRRISKIVENDLQIQTAINQD